MWHFFSVVHEFLLYCTPDQTKLTIGNFLPLLQERLRSHAQAFDGLLSLIPAKYYYGDDDGSVCH
jgi:hypothetical protein